MHICTQGIIFWIIIQLVLTHQMETSLHGIYTDLCAASPVALMQIAQPTLLFLIMAYNCMHIYIALCKYVTKQKHVGWTLYTQVRGMETRAEVVATIPIECIMGMCVLAPFLVFNNMLAQSRVQQHCCCCLVINLCPTFRDPMVKNINPD